MKSTSNKKFIETLITQRASELDMYTPLSRKLIEARAWLNKQPSNGPELLKACKEALTAATTRVAYYQTADAQAKIIKQIEQAIAKAT